MECNAAFIDDLTSHGSDFASAYQALYNMLVALREVRLYISPLKMKWGYHYNVFVWTSYLCGGIAMLTH